MKPLKMLMLCLFTATFTAPSLVNAENFPTRAITLVMPYAAGTGADGVGRALAIHLGKNLGQPVVIENRPGAGTNIGHAYVARAKPDGYTLIFGSIAGLAANKSLYSTLNYDPEIDLTPVAFLGKGAMVVLATPASGITSMAQLVKHANEHPDKVNFGAANTTARVWIEVIKSATGIQAETVLYSNAGSMITDLLGGQINFTVENTGTSRPLINSGKLVPLAVTSKVRGKFNPNIPTLSELGVTDQEIDTWYAVYAPKGTSSTIIKRLNAAINAAEADPEYVRAKDFAEYAEGGWTPEELGAFQTNEIAKWRDIVDRTGIRLN